MDYFTCFWAAKMTFMKFMYWRAQSSAAFITYSKKNTETVFKVIENKAEILLKLGHLGPTNILDFISCPTEKKAKATLISAETVSTG